MQNALNDHFDVRETIPDFFFLPELFQNSNLINFGRKQDKTVVNHVALPRWAEGNPYKFVAVLREAFESPYVSKNLNKWIDFIFGHKQSGSEAEASLNTYSMVTYEDKVDLEKLAVSDPGMAESFKMQMYNYG